MKKAITLLFAFLFFGAGIVQSIQATQVLPSSQTSTNNDVGTSQLLEQGLKALEKKDFKQSAAFFEQAANKGNSEAQYWLGVLFYEGEGVYMNKETAVMWFRKAAEQGSAHAQFNLGCCYNYGFGLKKDLSQAVYWFRKAAEQGEADAEFNLALCYGKGDGVSQDEREAIYWCQKAAEQGYVHAQEQLKKLGY